MPIKDSKEHFANVLYSVRCERGLSQIEMGELLKRSQNVISRLENGACGISLEGVCHIARVLKMSPRKFLPYV